MPVVASLPLKKVRSSIGADHVLGRHPLLPAAQGDGGSELLGFCGHISSFPLFWPRKAKQLPTVLFLCFGCQQLDRSFSPFRD